MAAWNLKTRTDAAHGNYAQVIIDRFLITGQVEDYDGDFDKDTADGAGLGSAVENNLPGIAKGMWKIKAKYSPTMDFQLQALKNRQTPFMMAIAPRGLSAGMPVMLMAASFSKYSPKGSKKDEVTVDMEVGARGFFHTGRVMLSPKTLLTGASGTGPEDDNTPYGGVSTYGGAMYSWLVDVVGGTAPTFTPKVQHATTSGGSYTDLATPVAASMTNVSTQVQYIEVPSTTTVNAFTQVAWTATGTPTSVQPFVAFARDYDPAA